MFKSKRLIVLLVLVFAFSIVTLNLNNASAGNPFAGNPFKLILKKLNKIILILEENLLPVPCDPVPCDPVPCIDYTQVPKTGKTTYYAEGDDGDLQKGVAWPDPRFTDNGDGTVTDNLTGLIWLQNANCFGERVWSTALTDCNTLQSGECGLTDGSIVGDWRLPNRKELLSLIDLGNFAPALPIGHPFNDPQSTYYWSSTLRADDSPIAWRVSMLYGFVTYSDMIPAHYVWPVRDGN